MTALSILFFPQACKKSIFWRQKSIAFFTITVIAQEQVNLEQHFFLVIPCCVFLLCSWFSCDSLSSLRGMSFLLITLISTHVPLYHKEAYLLPCCDIPIPKACSFFQKFRERLDLTILPMRRMTYFFIHFIFTYTSLGVDYHLQGPHRFQLQNGKVMGKGMFLCLMMRRHKITETFFQKYCWSVPDVFLDAIGILINWVSEFFIWFPENVNGMGCVWQFWVSHVEQDFSDSGMLVSCSIVRTEIHPLAVQGHFF